jgi:hypothetical protein
MTALDDSRIFFEHKPELAAASLGMRRGQVQDSARSQTRDDTIVTHLELPLRVYEGPMYPRYFDVPRVSSYHQGADDGPAVRKNLGRSANDSPCINCFQLHEFRAVDTAGG